MASIKSTLEFYVWVDPTDAIVRNNVGVVGGIFAEPPPKDFTPSDLMYVPNKAHKMGFVSPFHLNTIWHYNVECDLEHFRYERYGSMPSRLFALYLFNNREEALNYQMIHPEHVGNRILKRGIPSVRLAHSLHDGAWIDFLRVSRMMDNDTANFCWRGYWSGARMQDAGAFQHFGQPWLPKSFIETLFYGRISFPNKNLDKSD